jgi:dsRNA-specific ribonuclease
MRPLISGKLSLSGADTYQRLEFLSDAVLDMVVISAIATQPFEYSPGHMTMIKQAAVNASLLGFFCLKHSVSADCSRTEQAMRQNGTGNLFDDRSFLWKYLKLSGVGLINALEGCLVRFSSMESEIHGCLESASTYPWEALERLRPEKFLSDIIESILGAIFVDSSGDVECCERFLENIGFLRYLRRLCQRQVDVSKHTMQFN